MQNQLKASYGKMNQNLSKVKQFFTKRRPLFEAMGILAAITALFLQVPFESPSLKYIQALLLLLLVTVISISVVDILFNLIIGDKKYSSVVLSIGVIYSEIATLFLIHLFKFTWYTFNPQIKDYIGYTRVGVTLLLYFLSYKIVAVFENKSKIILIKLLREIVWLILVISIINSPFLLNKGISSLYKIELIVFLVSLSVNNLLSDIFPLYSKRISRFVGLLLLVVFTLLILLKIY